MKYFIEKMRKKSNQSISLETQQQEEFLKNQRVEESSNIFRPIKKMKIFEEEDDCVVTLSYKQLFKLKY